MPTLYFHAGMNKTGSTSAQNFFYSQRHKLATGNLAYPTLLSSNHSNFLQCQFGPNKDKLAPAIMERLGVTAAEVATVRAGFDRFLDDTARKGLDAVVSGEVTMKLKAKGYAEFRDACLAAFDRVVVLAMVRPPLSFARSAMQQRLKGRMFVDRFFEDRLPTPDYRTRFEQLIEAFGAESVRFRMFHKSTLVDGDILQTILSMMDGDRSALKAERAPRTNVSVSLTAGKVLSLLNGVLFTREVGPAVPAPIAERLRTGVLAAFYDTTKTRWIRQLPPHIKPTVLRLPGEPFVLSHEIATAVRDAAAEDAAWMSERMGVDVMAFDDPLPPSGSNPYATWTEAEIAAVTKALDEINALDEATIKDLADRQSERLRSRSARAVKQATSPARRKRRR